jgi:hypothetical protein
VVQNPRVDALDGERESQAGSTPISGLGACDLVVTATIMRRWLSAGEVIEEVVAAD